MSVMDNVPLLRATGSVDSCHPGPLEVPAQENAHPATEAGAWLSILDPGPAFVAPLQRRCHPSASACPSTQGRSQERSRDRSESRPSDRYRGGDTPPTVGCLVLTTFPRAECPRNQASERSSSLGWWCEPPRTRLQSCSWAESRRKALAPPCHREPSAAPWDSTPAGNPRCQ